MLHVAGVDVSLLTGHFQRHQELGGPVSIIDQVDGRNPSCFLLSIQEPADLHVAWMEISHMADEQVVGLQGLFLGGGGVHFKLD